MSGSIGAVIDAVKHGDDCRILEDDKVLYTADNLHYDDAETSVVAMAISRIRAEERIAFGYKLLAFSVSNNKFNYKLNALNFAT